jgi:hypothetical protein
MRTSSRFRDVVYVEGLKLVENSGSAEFEDARLLSQTDVRAQINRSHDQHGTNRPSRVVGFVILDPNTRCETRATPNDGAR